MTPYCHNHRDLGKLILIGFVLTMVIVAIDLLFYAETLEDAFITFRYSQHLAEGYGFGAWNTNGERIEGYSNFLWMIMLAGGRKLGLSIETFAKTLGIISHIATSLLFLFFPYFRKVDLAKPDALLNGHQDIFILASLISALYLPLSWYASSGMETLTFVLLVTLCLLGPVLVSGALLPAMIGVALVLLRPEGLLFAVACYGFHFWYRKKAQQPVKPIIVALFSVAITLMLLTLFRLQVFGEFLPNTYYAKVSAETNFHIYFGTVYLKDWIKVHAWWFPILIAAACFIAWSLWKSGFDRNRAPLFVLLFMGVYLLYVIRIGGDNYSAFPYWRHILHLWPFLVLLLATGMVVAIPTLTRNVWLIRYVLLAGTLLAINYNILHIEGQLMLNEVRRGMKNYPTLANAPHNFYFTWLDQIADSNTVIASSMAGELPFVVDAVHIDLLGLNDYYIARYGHFDPHGPVDSKTDMDIVLRRRPDIIEGYISASMIVDRQPRHRIVRYRAQMTHALLEHPIFRSEYVFLINGPYDHLDRALFLRRTYWKSHLLKDKLNCIAISETGL